MHHPLKPLASGDRAGFWVLLLGGWIGALLAVIKMDLAKAAPGLVMMLVGFAGLWIDTGLREKR